ncbi:DUF2125 domain-containing protein, partial [Paracoccus sp. (in: a-proteobacteria)]|uniref:DUF2125 domain-containing protein n=1 Tax=Paracoccus sp. TaxID=267 RepID=UPI00289F1F0A
MRILVIFFTLFVVLAGGWLIGESWLAQKAAEVVAQNPQLRVASVSALRDPGRFGLALSEPGVSSDGFSLSAPDLSLWVSPLAPTTLEAALPAQIMFAPRPGEAIRELGLNKGTAYLTVAPFRDLSFTRASLSAQDLTLDGLPVAKALSATSRMQDLAADAPPQAHAAYDVVFDLQSLNPASLPNIDLSMLPSGDLSLNGHGRVWLEDALSPSSTAQNIQLIGLEADQLSLGLGDLKARIVGRVQADENGYAQGKVMVFTANTPEILQALAAAGVISPKTVPFAMTMLKQLSKEGAEPSNAPATGQLAPAPAPVPAKAGEIRLPITFADGKTMLGPIALGPAPRFAP